ncbi:MAG: UDP-N-acetylglucosamine--N-acetylmuramyl-(pentapeptide) pyrophosphoryl-undecaprenol N-acetylglucosamine transferase [Lentimonas sp.]|jgi:UDP-N-acetylglucosamine--N-acetylmuramyl-(pentapeptide) pyrophosphoryl-undecaprenol N-acetylglucosamine transferase
MAKTIIITTGGTGGHIFPARILARSLSNQGFKVLILGDKNYAKYHQADDQFKFHIISSSKIVDSPWPLIKAAFKISCGIIQSLFFLLKYRPQKVVAFGGYSTFPILVSAILLRRKIILHEQNAHMGKVNRIFSKYAHKIALTYQKTDGFAAHTKIIVTGNPVREEILSLSKEEYQLPHFNKAEKIDNLGYDVVLASQFHQKSNKETFNILIIGGSGGAKIFSEILPKAIFNLPDRLKDHLKIEQQCRLEDCTPTFDSYESFDIAVNISNFFVNIAEKISQSHLIIARSGSSSLAEFCCAKKPMILVPFANSADNHQEKNALHVSDKGAAIVIKEGDFNIQLLTQTLGELIDNPAILQKMSKAALKCANLKANENLTNLCKN